MKITSLPYVVLGVLVVTLLGTGLYMAVRVQSAMRSMPTLEQLTQQ